PRMAALAEEARAFVRAELLACERWAGRAVRFEESGSGLLAEIDLPILGQTALRARLGADARLRWDGPANEKALLDALVKAENKLAPLRELLVVEEASVEQGSTAAKGELRLLGSEPISIPWEVTAGGLSMKLPAKAAEIAANLRKT